MRLVNIEPVLKSLAKNIKIFNAHNNRLGATIFRDFFKELHNLPVVNTREIHLVCWRDPISKLQDYDRCYSSLDSARRYMRTMKEEEPQYLWYIKSMVVND